MVCNLAHKLGFLSFMGRAPEGKIYCRANADPNITNLIRVGGETLTYVGSSLRSRQERCDASSEGTGINQKGKLVIRK